MKTYTAKPSNIKKEWILIDANKMVLGRLSTILVKLLKGKHKPEYTPHMDCGDNIVLINAEQIILTGKKLDINTGKRYYRHTGYPGGIKEVTAGKLRATGKNDQIIKKAVKGMMRNTPLSRERLKNLYVYNGEQHPHTGQQPRNYVIQDRGLDNKTLS